MRVVIRRDWMIEMAENDQEFIYRNLIRWIENEHSLISSRMGWLMSSNAFLITPLSIILASHEDPNDDAMFLEEVLCYIGIISAVLLGITIWLAIHTMNTLVKRKREFVDTYPNIKDKFMFTELSKIPRNVSRNKWPTRIKYTHEISMFLQLIIPLIVLAAWVIIYQRILG